MAALDAPTSSRGGREMAALNAPTSLRSDREMAALDVLTFSRLSRSAYVLSQVSGCHHRSKLSMNPSEVEFLGEKQLVSIVPNFNSDVIYLISGSVGPFRAGLPVKVPIWLAVCLKQKQKCRIISQEWMNFESLNEKKEMEKMSKLFTAMPSFHYMDESQILLSIANDDIPDADEIRIAVKDIWDIRMSKLRTSVDAFIKSEGVHARLDHLTAMEINGIRPLLPHALDQMLRIQSANTGEPNSQYSGSM